MPLHDCLGRCAYISLNTLDEVEELVLKNWNTMATLESMANFSVNGTILEMVRIYKAAETDATLSQEDAHWKSIWAGDFFHDDELDLLPIPVMTNVNPSNTHSFFIHIVLLLGKYATEIDVLRNTTPRECFEKAKLVGT